MTDGRITPSSRGDAKEIDTDPDTGRMSSGGRKPQADLEMEAG